LNLQEKQNIVAELQDRFAKAKIVIATDYKGLDVTAINDLRRKLREAAVEYKVVKNTLLTRAAQETDAALISDHFKGPSAVALSYDDPVAPAKVLTQFMKDNKKLEIKAGVMNGKALDLDEIKALSALPSREILLAKLLSTMVAVPTGLVSALSDLPRKMVTVLQAIKDQKEQQAA
jgi:large subunit ribosomal protein L10